MHSIHLMRYDLPQVLNQGDHSVQLHGHCAAVVVVNSVVVDVVGAAVVYVGGEGGEGGEGGGGG